MTRRTHLTLTLATIIPAGLIARYAPLHLPWAISKYAGSVLWAIALYLFLGILLPRLQPARLALLAITLATLTELSRLAHSAPIFSAVDAFRQTLPGKILLGRFFSVKDIAAYLLAIAAAAALDQALTLRRH